MKQLQVALLFLTVIFMCVGSMGSNITCKEAERKALLVFKQSFTYDGLNLLGSWVGQDCCSWKGVGCDHLTGHVIRLDLGGSEFYHLDNVHQNSLEAGEVNHALLELKFLNYLDLSWIGFQWSVIPDLFGSMKKLQYLNLSHTDLFVGKFPRNLGNLTELVSLDLRDSCVLCKIEGNGIEWALKLQKLKYLDLSGIDLSQALDNSFTILHKLLSLSVLNLHSCSLGNSHHLTTISNISSSLLQRLDLRNNFFSGTIPHFLQNLSSLKFLDLSYNQLNSPIPSWFDNKVELEYLSLGSNNFDGPFPSFIQKLSFLIGLDLSYNQFSFSIPSWLSNNTYLEVLSLRGNRFNHVDGGIMIILGSLCRIRGLDLSYNQLQEEVSESHDNYSKCTTYNLEYLDMSYNNISGSLPIFASLSSLRILYLSHNNFEYLPSSFWNLLIYFVDLSHNYISDVSSVLGSLPSLDTLCMSHNHFSVDFGSLSPLSTLIGNLSILDTLCLFHNDLPSLDLSHNHLKTLPPSFGNLSYFSMLDLSHNNLTSLPPSFGDLSSLSMLDLSHNNLKTLPHSIGVLSSLPMLDLSHNNLETLPPSFGNLSSLNHLDLSHNNLVVVHQVSLGNLSSLKYLDISLNSNSVILDLSPDWMPPFQLDYLSVLPCRINTSFPKWVSSQQNLQELDLSDTGIFGALPHNIGTAMPNLASLRLANNRINGSIPRSLCWLEKLGYLDLQKNRLSGMIPDCWANFQMMGLELSSNRLSGLIPTSLAVLPNLQLLSLNNNLLEGEVPLQFNNSARLTILDVGRNNLHGEIPPWNGANFPILQIVILRENRLNGTIPQQLCSFRALQIIDLAKNNLVGIIPPCFGNFPRMGSVQHSSSGIADPPTYFAAEPAVSPDDWSAVESIKGAEREYTSVLHLLVNMDLSSNKFVGAIPPNIFNSIYLVGLNLSCNHLNGTIPNGIGNMTHLESLDLSINNLSGKIPESIALLDSLSSLNFSFNNLHGQIPTSPHLMTLNDSSIYMGNSGLCGDPLPSCFPTPIVHAPTNMVDEEQNKHEKMWLYLITMSGFATGFWGIIGTLLLNKKWRYAYFGIAEELADWIYVKVAVRMARAKRTG